MGLTEIIFWIRNQHKKSQVCFVTLKATYKGHIKSTHRIYITIVGVTTPEFVIHIIVLLSHFHHNRQVCFKTCSIPILRNITEYMG